MNNKGFSLAETMFAIALIAIIGGVVLLNATRLVRDSKIQSYSQELKTMENAAFRYYKANGGYPVSTATGNKSNVSTQMGKYLENTDIDTRWGVSCDKARGITVFAHHVPGDLLPAIQTMFSECADFDVTTDVVSNYVDPAGGVWGQTIFCRQKMRGTPIHTDVTYDDSAGPGPAKQCQN